MGTCGRSGKEAGFLYFIVKIMDDKNASDVSGVF